MPNRICCLAKATVAGERVVISVERLSRCACRRRKASRSLSCGLLPLRLAPCNAELRYCTSGVLRFFEACARASVARSAWSSVPSFRRYNKTSEIRSGMLELVGCGTAELTALWDGDAVAL